MKVNVSAMFLRLVFAFCLLSLLVNVASAVNSDSTEIENEKLPTKVRCIEPYAACAESEKVIETLNLMLKLIVKGDLDSYQDYLADGCTTFDEGTKKLIAGREAVIADLKRKIEEWAPTGESPLLSYTIDRPYAKVTGNTAVVTFKAVKEFGGKHPVKMEAQVTDVFIKEGEKWKKLHFRARWKKIA